jgi:hypothetical protein
MPAQAGIHALTAHQQGKTWMAGTRPAMTKRGNMITSRDRILTTHVGSLPRNETITELLIKREADGQVDPKKMADELDRAVAEVVKRQGRRHRHRQ